MDIAKYIRMCCIERNNMQMKELSEKTEQTQQNLTNKMRNNNFKTSELEKIAAALDSRLEIKFIDNATGQPIIQFFPTTHVSSLFFANIFVFFLDNTHNAYYIISMKDKELLSLLQKNGWLLDRINGSHYILVKDNQTISLPIHGKDMKKGLETAILKKAGLK